MRWLTDNDVNTCNNRNTSSVLVDLETPIPLTWVRLVVKDSGKSTTAVNVTEPQLGQ